MLCRDSGMEGHTQKYHIVIMLTGRSPAKREPILYIPVTAQPPARPFFAGTIFTDDRKPVDEIEAYQTTQQCRIMIIK